MTDKQEELKNQEAETTNPSEEAEAAASEQEDAKASEQASEGATELEKTSEEKPAEEQEDFNTKYLRLMADFQNYKRRVEREKKDLYSYANERIMVDLLEVMDNFERALEQNAGDGFKEGMEMIFKQLGTVLEKSGLAEIPALGEEFDPNVHNAVMTEETEEYESGKVSGVMQKGYSLNGKVIRPSMVKVAN